MVGRHAAPLTPGGKESPEAREGRHRALIAESRALRGVLYVTGDTSGLASPPVLASMAPALPVLPAPEADAEQKAVRRVKALQRIVTSSAELYEQQLTR